MAEEKKRHHYVPQFYLREFARGKQIGTVRLEDPRRFTQSVSTACSELLFHTVPGHPDGDAAFEDVLAEIEGDAAAIFRDIAEGIWPLPPEARSEFAQYIALQAARGAEFRRTMSYMAQQVLRMQVGAAGKESLRTRLAKALGDEVSDDLLSAVWEQSIRPEGPPVQLTAAGHIDQMADIAEAITPLLERRAWGLVRFVEHHLLTSDTPVCLVGDPNAPEDAGLGFATALMVIFPLSRTTGLFMTRLTPPHYADRVLSGELDYEEQPSDHYERWFNLHTIMNASEAIFHHPDDGDLVPSELPPARPVSARIAGAPESFTG
ncbi:DUF4238 domain-containing protein [Microbacterium trichothecenolyticum]|uniref:DUF4238 domain-containing protein n=1 Tax=Microbacterium trichothecenolyticum TaxID=69370 RepID=UPI0035BE5A36